MLAEDYLKQMKETEDWYDKRPIRGFIRSCWYTLIYRIPGLFTDTKYEIKKGFQRMFRGYDDSDVWGYSTNNTIRQIKILQKLRRTKVGVPYTVFDKDGQEASFEEQEKNWDAIIDAMIDGFQAILDFDDVHVIVNGKYSQTKSHAERMKCLKRFKAGMKLYAKHYLNLWD